MLFTHVWRSGGTSWKLVSSSQFRDPRVAPSAPATPQTTFGAPGVQLNGPIQPQPAAPSEQTYVESIAAPLPTPPAGVPLRVGGDIKEPKKIRDVKPVYPEIAMASGVQGIVILELRLDEEGGVASAKILRSQPLLDQAALDAVGQWKFTPTLLNGAPVEVVMNVSVEFRLSD
jgi:protein TonB